jgi:tetrapyrrole methylase family protein/MazG family protein
MTGPLEKIKEEYYEVLDAIKRFGKDDERVEDEIGDLIFAVVNLSRFLDVNPEVALNKTNKKFIKRIEFMELESKKMGKKLETMDLQDMEDLWNKAKDS